MKKSVGDGIDAVNANWNFKGEVAKSFDGHVSKSVPFYKEGHDLILRISDFFVKEDSVCYELGSSTGALTLKLAKHNQHKKKARFIGFDIEKDMVKVANGNKKKSNIKNATFQFANITKIKLKPSDFIVAYYTVQFIRPSERQELINKIYKTLKWGGAFLLFEKVRANDARFQDMMTSLYHDFKHSQGYSGEEIFSKARSLKGVLEPFSSKANLDMLKRAGFVDIISVMKYTCFEGFLAVK